MVVVAECTPKTTTHLVVVDVHSWVRQKQHTLVALESASIQLQVIRMNIKIGEVWNEYIVKWKVQTGTHFTSDIWNILKILIG